MSLYASQATGESVDGCIFVERMQDGFQDGYVDGCEVAFKRLRCEICCPSGLALLALCASACSSSLPLPEKEKKRQGKGASEKEEEKGKETEDLYKVAPDASPAQPAPRRKRLNPHSLDDPTQR